MIIFERKSRPLSHLAWAARQELVKRAIHVLFARQIQILGIDLNRAPPVIEIADMPRNHKLGDAAPYRHSRDHRGLVRRYQVSVEGCRVEWDRIGEGLI